MKSLRELYRAGHGPSSSHTMAPLAAAERFRAARPDAARYRVTLFGSLAATGRGHLTDDALQHAFRGKRLEIAWRPEEELDARPNGMLFEAFGPRGGRLACRADHSVGGGALRSDDAAPEVYRQPNLAVFLAECEKRNEPFWRCAVRAEDAEILDFLAGTWQVMRRALESGLRARDPLPGRLHLPRQAHRFFARSAGCPPDLRETALLCAYAYAVAEENAAGGRIVTAPTCGSCGVLPAVLHYLGTKKKLPDREIARALATAGLFGNVVKANGSISGARVGCQGEIGTACAMAAAAAAQICGGTLRQVEYAAEMGLEHHLGLTCDPVDGLVQIPCIERNAHAALRALACARLALLSGGDHRISFDDAVSVLLETGQALAAAYRETSTGGLARQYRQRLREKRAADKAASAGTAPGKKVNRPAGVKRRQI